MRDDIPPDVRDYLDGVAQYLRGRNGGKRIPVAWTRYLTKPVARKRGRPPHPQRKEITIRLLRECRSNKRGALNGAIMDASKDYGVDMRTLKGWIRWPRLNEAGEYTFEPSPELIEAMVSVVTARMTVYDKAEAVAVRTTRRRMQIRDWHKRFRSS